MGFGLLFIGYFVTYFMALNSIGAFFRLIGYCLMCYATGKLSEYNKSFRFAQLGALTLVIFSIVDSLALATGFLYDNLVFSNDFMAVLPMDILLKVESVFVLAYHVLLLLAIRDIARDTDVHKIAFKAYRNMFFIGLYYVLSIIGYIPFGFQESYSKNMGLPLLILYVAWVIMDLFLVFSCYANICDESDLAMDRKASRFSFVNKYRAELEKKQQKAREETLKYKQEKEERRRSKKSQK